MADGTIHPMVFGAAISDPNYSRQRDSSDPPSQQHLIPAPRSLHPSVAEKHRAQADPCVGWEPTLAGTTGCVQPQALTAAAGARSKGVRGAVHPH